MLLRVVIALAAYWISILEYVFQAVLGHFETGMGGRKKKIL